MKLHRKDNPQYYQQLAAKHPAKRRLLCRRPGSAGPARQYSGVAAGLSGGVDRGLDGGHRGDADESAGRHDGFCRRADRRELHRCRRRPACPLSRRIGRSRPGHTRRRQASRTAGHGRVLARCLLRGRRPARPRVSPICLWDWLAYRPPARPPHNRDNRFCRRKNRRRCQGPGKTAKNSAGAVPSQKRWQ